MLEDAARQKCGTPVNKRRFFNNNLFAVATTPQLSLTWPRILLNIPRLHDGLNRPSLPYRSMKLVRMLGGPSLQWSFSAHTLKHLIRWDDGPWKAEVSN
jgi:hypothetical protein